MAQRHQRLVQTSIRFVSMPKPVRTQTRRRLNTSVFEASTTPPLVLRDYQLEAIEKTKSAIARGIKRPAVVLATGGGKTVVFSHLIPQLIDKDDPIRRKTLVLAHKEELVYQAAKTIILTNPEMRVDIDMRNFKFTDDADVVVASVPTLIRVARLERYDPSLFKTIILDECHHASANSWLKILRYFGALDPELPINVVGFTATLERNDGKNLGDIFDEVVFERTLMQMVKNNELADVRFTCIKTKADLADVEVKGGDYESKSLSEVINTEETNLLVAYSYQKLREKYNFKTTLIFCVDIDHCKTLCGVLQRSGINAQYVTGATAKQERAAIVQDFKDGKISVLCNVQVFTEGTDVPNIDSLFLVRPTKSRSLLVQMLGRGLRLYQDKTHCHVVDLVGSRGPGMQSVPTLFSLPADHQIEGKNLTQLEEEKRKIDERRAELQEQELYEREHKRRLEEEALVKKLERLSMWENGDEELFDTFDGFSALDIHDEQMYQLNKNVCEEIRSSSLAWVRLEYDLWGCSVDHRFLLLHRDQTEDGKVSFSLCVSTFVPLEARKSANFRIRKFGNEKVIESGTNLKPLLNKAEVQFRSMAARNYLNDNQRQATKSQISYLKMALLKRATLQYPEVSDIERKVDAAVQKMNFVKASMLIFAMLYSSTSLHVKWELQKMFGLDERAKKEASAISLKLQKQLAKIAHAEPVSSPPSPTTSSW